MKAYTIQMLAPDISTSNFRSHIANLITISNDFVPLSTAIKLFGIKNILGGVAFGIVADDTVDQQIQTIISSVVMRDPDNSSITVEVQTLTLESEIVEFEQTGGFIRMYP